MISVSLKGSTQDETYSESVSRTRWDMASTFSSSRRLATSCKLTGRPSSRSTSTRETVNVSNGTSDGISADAVELTFVVNSLAGVAQRLIRAVQPVRVLVHVMASGERDGGVVEDVEHAGVGNCDTTISDRLRDLCGLATYRA